MAKNNTLTLTQAQLNDIIAQAVAGALAVSGKQADKAPTSKKSTTTKSTKKFAFEKADGTIAYAKSQAQFNAWKAYAERSSKRVRKTAEELQAYTDAFKWTKALDKAIKANPSITCKQIHELGGKGCTKPMLKERKVALGVR